MATTPRSILVEGIPVSPSRLRVGDLALLRSGTPREEISPTAPLHCAEILSPEDRIRRAKQVLADYGTTCVAQSWLIDPLRRDAFTSDSGGLQLIEEGRLELPGTPIYVILRDLFKALDQQ